LAASLGVESLELDQNPQFYCLLKDLEGSLVKLKDFTECYEGCSHPTPLELDDQETRTKSNRSVEVMKKKR